MLTKQQSLAAADALILRVRAEKLRRLERRTARWSVIYPAMRVVPLQEREGLMDAARDAVLRSWLVWTAAALGVSASVWAYLGRVIFETFPVEWPVYPVGPLAVVAFAVVRTLYIRAFLKSEVLTRYPLSRTDVSSTSA
jgi:hypothetical protein